MNVANPRCFAALLLLCGSVEFALAEGPQQLLVSRPFVQVKTTDAAGNVSYRVGGVFTEGADPARRVSLTFVCQGGKLSFFTVHQHVPRGGGSAAKIAFHVNDQPGQVVDATRALGNDLSSYTVANSTEAETLARLMGGGRTLRLELETYAYELPLEGLRQELDDLAAVCPHG